MKKIILSALIFTSFNGIAGSPITVGADNDNACDYHNIQDAIDNGNNDTIRIASNKNYFENLTVTNESKQLIGGYADCTMAAMNITDLSQAILTGNGVTDTISISNFSVGSYDVLLRNLFIANGLDGVYVTSQNNAESQATLNNVRLFNNNHSGLSVVTVNGGELDVVVNDSVLDLNEKSGITCGGSVNMKIAGETLISENEADSGAGIFINSCEVEIYSPTKITNNSADSHGGGVFANGEASVQLYGMFSHCNSGICFGEWETPVTISDNKANANNNGYGNGGGIDVTGSGTLLLVYNALIEGNEAKNGGGISADNQATALISGYQSPEQSCWDSGSCSQLNDNKAITGGAMYASYNSSITTAAATFKNNSADIALAAAALNGSSIEISSSIVSNNGFNGVGEYEDRNVFTVSSNIDNPGSQLTLDYVTVADNQVVNHVIQNSSSEVNVFSSIIFDEQEVYYEAGSPLSSDFECMIVHEDDSFSAGGTVSVVDREVTPLFVNPIAGNYHLRVDSLAIDYCYDASGNAGSDIDYDSRGIDNPDVANLHGNYDIGADEFHINNDIIFKHGFEQD